MTLRRIQIRGGGIFALNKAPAVKKKVQETAQRIDRAAQSQGSQTQYDYTDGSARPRAAVIAGYERGATASSTRSILLRSLDGG